MVDSNSDIFLSEGQHPTGVKPREVAKPTFLSLASPKITELLLLLPFKFHLNNKEVVVAQLLERSLLTPELCYLNPAIGKILSTNCTFE